MPTEYDAGKVSLESLIQWAEANDAAGKRNEAATRLHLIDRLVLDILQWPRTAVHPEERAEPGWIDYALGSLGTKLIIEAKREGLYFDLPAGAETGVHSIESLTDGKSGKGLREAMQQAIQYAASKGVGPAAVCNGHQLVVFQAIRTDGVEPLKGRALIFPSLEDMRSSFRLLWDNVSPFGVDSRTIYQTLRTAPAPPPAPLSSHINGYPGIKRRNDLQAGMDILAELFLEDVARLEELRADFLRDCYASSGALSQYALISRQILQTRYALLQEEQGPDVAPAYDKRGVSPALTQGMLVAAASRRPIVLLGDVGVGKTTFIQRLVHVEAEEIFQHAFNIYIDFGASTTLGDLKTFVIEEAARQLLQRYEIDIEEADFVEDVYREELKRLEKRVLGRLRDLDPITYERQRVAHMQRWVDDRAQHLKASLERLQSSHRRQIVVFLDNIDQRSDSDQEQVFLISNELGQNWPATVFVTLRPETFYSSSRRGALSGYQPRVFTISPPRADVMLQRRVDFVLAQLNETGRLGSFPVNVTVDSDSLVAFLEVLAENFRKNEKLLALIDNIAGGNMRLALKFVTGFLGSGHVNTAKILQIYRESGTYTIAIHEFLRAILYGDHSHYDPESSAIANLFRITQPDGREHFLLPILLAQTQVLGERLREEGYVSAEELYGLCQQLGFGVDQINSALDYATQHRLLDSAPRFSGDQPRLHYRITTVGAYTTKVLLAYFAYVDAALVDTPVIDDQYRRLIDDVHPLADRVVRAEYFRLYLDKQWGKITADGIPWQWSDTSAQLADDIAKVGRYADPDSWGWNRS